VYEYAHGKVFSATVYDVACGAANDTAVHGELEKLAQSGGFDALIPSPECATPGRTL
jgi:hypothetical protein